MATHTGANVTSKKTNKEQSAVDLGTGPVWDWAAGHGPVTGALSATTGAFAVATCGAAAGMPPGWALAVGSAGALGHAAAGIRLRNAGRTIAARASSWLIGGGWTAWAMTHGPLTWEALGSLAAIGVAMGTVTRSTNLYEEAREEEALAAEQRQITAELSAERRAIAEEWATRIERVCGLRLRILGIERWEAGTGFTLDAELPGGAVYDAIAKKSAALSADARLPHGCTVTAGPGVHQGRTLIDVGTVNVLEKETTYPTGYEPLSIHTGIPWGYRSNADEILTYLREQCALVVGPTGSGKTNMVHVILAGFARATDVLPWVIDLNAGSAGLPWVLPALESAGSGRPVRPGIDWLASTFEEAMLMLDTALAVARYRKVAYQDLLARENTDLLPISPSIPQIELVIDEGAEILVSTDRRMRKLAEKILEVIRISRAMGVRTVLTALGATGSVLGNLMIRREAKVRAALTGGETEGMDLSKMFPGSRGLRPEQAPYKGSGFMGTPESPVGLFKVWRIKPHQIRDIVHATSDRHPRLDDVSAKAAGEAYARRWDADRIAWMRDGAPTAEPAAGPAVPGVEQPGTRRGLNLTALREQDDNPAGGEHSAEDALAAEFLKQIDATFGTAPEPHRDRAPRPDRPERPGLNLSAFRKTEGEQPARDAEPAEGPEWLAEVIDAIESTGSLGMKPSAVADLVGKDRKTVRAALQDAVGRGQLVYRDNGPHSVYVHPDHA
ncbi:hypothetical protein [Streptomyces longispororuber]|uniref:hypothetical protein n=1 Tax=Streptomyces longispororuber TaxID=68230 RepID=UPI00210E2B6B|nr:hypothetical protein [Streptomyces longispororuber]MCQ4212374.1 hypothetical protein [Streptomyces longispororuber]